VFQRIEPLDDLVFLVRVDGLWRIQKGSDTCFNRRSSTHGLEISKHGLAFFRMFFKQGTRVVDSEAVRLCPESLKKKKEERFIEVGVTGVDKVGLLGFSDEGNWCVLGRAR